MTVNRHHHHPDPCVYHPEIMVTIKRDSRDARHTHTLFVFGSHALAVNIDMDCESSAALVCLCKKYKKLCKKFANLFSLCFVFLIHRQHHHTERLISCCCVSMILSFFVSRKDCVFSFFGCWWR